MLAFTGGVLFPSWSKAAALAWLSSFERWWRRVPEVTWQVKDRGVTELGFNQGSLTLAMTMAQGTWVTQLAGHLTSAQVMISWSVGLSPVSGSVLTAQSLEPALDSVSPSLCPSPGHALSLSLKKWINIKKKSIHTCIHTSIHKFKKIETWRIKEFTYQSRKKFHVEDLIPKRWRQTRVAFS